MQIHNVDLYEAMHYRIHALGGFDAAWLDMLSGDWAIAEQRSTVRGATILVEQVVDQAALVGVINTLYGFGLSLLVVECLTEGCNEGGSDMAA